MSTLCTWFVKVCAHYYDKDIGGRVAGDKTTHTYVRAYVIDIVTCSYNRQTHSCPISQPFMYILHVYLGMVRSPHLGNVHIQTYVCTYIFSDLYA